MENQNRRNFRFLVTGSIILFWICFINIVNAQDTIYYHKLPFEVVKVTAIGPFSVKYKKLSMPDGPEYVISKRTVKKIVYADGTTADLHYKNEQGDFNYSKNILKGNTHVNLILSDLYWGFAGMEFERGFLNGRIAVKIPVSFGPGLYDSGDSASLYNNFNRNFIFHGQYGYYNENKIFSTGFELYYYTSGKDLFNYFLGPAWGIGRFRYLSGVYPMYSPSDEITAEEGSYTSLYFKNGVRIQPMKHLNISIALGTGIYFTDLHIEGYGVIESTTEPSMEGSVSVGYTF